VSFISHVYLIRLDRHRTETSNTPLLGLGLDNASACNPHVQPLDDPVDCKERQGSQGDDGWLLQGRVEGVGVGDL
jgi:hypothetical protein